MTFLGLAFTSVRPGTVHFFLVPILSLFCLQSGRPDLKFTGSEGKPLPHLTLLLRVVRRSRSGHLHARLRLVCLLYGRGVSLPDLDLVVLLDDGAAWAPVRDAAVVEAAALDVVALPDLAALEHRVAVRQDIC